LIRNGARGELVGLEGRRRNRGFAVVDADLAVHRRRRRPVDQRLGALDLVRFRRREIERLAGRQLERRLGRRVLWILLRRLRAGQARKQDQRHRQRANRQQASRMHFHVHHFGDRVRFLAAVNTTSWHFLGSGSARPPCG